MQAGLETQAIIDSLSDPILVIGPHRGRVVAYNAAFVRELGSFGENFRGRSFTRMPQFVRSVRRGLLDLYVRAKRRKDDKPPFSFQYVDAQGYLKSLSASAGLMEWGDRSSVVFHFRSLPASTAAAPQQAEDTAAFSTLVDMTREPWMEFRSHQIVEPISLDDEDKAGRLLALGQKLVVHKASKAAQKVFASPNSSLDSATSPIMGKDFISFFHREEDALRFLDMLSNVGQLRAPTTLIDGSGKMLDVEMSCAARFESGDAIAALYCIPRSSELSRNYKTLLSENRKEQEFIFNQPFLGLGQLVPSQPLDRPDPAHVDEVLNSCLESIRLLNANDALASHYGTLKSSLLMQPMSCLFPSRSAGIQVLKELFVTRQSSFATYDEKTEELQRITLFKALFNDADCMVRIFVASSPQPYGFKERHSNQKNRSTPAFI